MPINRNKKETVTDKIKYGMFNGEVFPSKQYLKPSIAPTIGFKQ
jgi:hypothetical protein